MNHSEIVRILSDRTDMTQKDVKQLLSNIVGSLDEIMGECKGFSIPDLGTFGTHVREERKAYSIPDARNMIIPPKRLVYFSPATHLKDEFKETAAEVDSAETASVSVKPAATVELSEHEQMQQELATEVEAAPPSGPAVEEPGADVAPDEDREEAPD